MKRARTGVEFPGVATVSKGGQEGKDRASLGVREQLARLAVNPSKVLGQNFLHDPNMARWIVRQADASGMTQILEVGPGLGAISTHLLEFGLPMVAIEKDRRLAAALRERLADRGLEVVEGDATQWDLRPRFAFGPALFAGNLPYRVTTPLLFHFLGEASPVERGIVMLQREVALRLAAAPGSPDYGSLTLAIGRRWRVEYLRTVPPRLFHPVPQVDSAVVRLVRRPTDEFPPCSPGIFESLVRAGFSQRRKQLRNRVGDRFPEWERTARDFGFRPDARAEDLSLEQWIELARRADSQATALPQDEQAEVFDVVDERDRPIDRATRREVHVNNLRHRAVHVWVFNRAGDLFLQRRSPWKDRHPGVWDSSASGHLDAGETYAAAAVREIREELGVEPQHSLEEIARIDASEATGMEFVRLFRTLHEGPFRLPPAEIETGGFFPMAVVAEWVLRRPNDFAPGFRVCWERWAVSEVDTSSRLR